MTSGVERGHPHRAVKVYQPTRAYWGLRVAVILLAGLTLFVLFTQILIAGA